MRRYAAWATGVAVTVTAAVVPVVAGGSSAVASTLTVSATGRIAVSARGNGHGHGMSQYGARGAALAGKSYRTILGFYYPHTTLTRLAPSSIRVKLSGFGSTTTVGATPGMTVTGSSRALPSTHSGVSRYRLVADSGRSLTLQQLKFGQGAHWTTYRSHLANGTAFHRYPRIRLYKPDNSSTEYRGSLRAFRKSASGAHGVYTVDAVSLDDYTAGVAPREMPASWPSQAGNSQAVAARTYGRYAVEHPGGTHYDICDTTMCQVYGGQERFSRTGHSKWTEQRSVALATSNQVLRYRGRTIFAQFSASNGGYMVSGGQPYLVTKADPYDNARSGDPYLSYRNTVSVRSVASYYGLAKVTRLVITRRDGHGQWGGRVLSASVQGTTSSGKAKTVTTDGGTLQWALGVGTSWFQVARG